MNTPNDLLKRLVKLFPVNSLKTRFDVRLTSEDLYNHILANNTPQAIEDFVIGNLDATKQHIYIFSLNAAATADGLDLPNFPFTIINRRNRDGVFSITISPEVEFLVTVTDPFEEVGIRFRQPYRIDFTRTHMIIYATILEKDMSPLFPNNRRVIDVQRQNGESVVMDRICEHLLQYNPQRCDLHRGVKHLWERDEIDSKHAKWKKGSSTATEVMDGEYTLKQQYPDVYNTIVTAPIKKTVFKYIRDDEELPKSFTIDPQFGHISIPLYPRNLNQNRNVVSKILSNNQ